MHRKVGLLAITVLVALSGCLSLPWGNETSTAVPATEAPAMPDPIDAAKLHVLGVNGSMVIMEHPSGLAIMDTGPAEAEEGVLEAIFELPSPNIDTLILTGHDADRAGNCPAVVHSILLETAYVTHRGSGDERCDNALSRSGAIVRDMATMDDQFAATPWLRLLGAPSGTALLADIHNARVLVAGSMECSDLASRRNIASDILVVAPDLMCEDLLLAVLPDVVVVAGSLDNRGGIEAIGAEAYSAQDGTVTIENNGVETRVVSNGVKLWSAQSWERSSQEPPASEPPAADEAPAVVPVRNGSGPPMYQGHGIADSTYRPSDSVTLWIYVAEGSQSIETLDVVFRHDAKTWDLTALNGSLVQNGTTWTATFPAPNLPGNWTLDHITAITGNATHILVEDTEGFAVTADHADREAPTLVGVWSIRSQANPGDALRIGWDLHDEHVIVEARAELQAPGGQRFNATALNATVVGSPESFTWDFYVPDAPYGAWRLASLVAVDEHGNVAELATWEPVFTTEASGGDWFVTVDYRAEVVVLRNPFGAPIDLTGYRLENRAGDTWTFPSVTLNASAEIRIHSGVGSNNATDLFMSRGETWSNHSDVARLLNDRGEEVARYEYAQ